MGERVNCRWNGINEPRTVVGRHDAGCENGECRGCLPCPENHCGRCYREHVGEDYTCPGCIADARDDLTAITTMCAALPAEVRHRGVDSEAMNLLGPVADPESVGHVRASIAVGRIDAGWLAEADNELHPLLVLGTWWEAYAEALEHTEPGRIEVRDAAAYLNRHLHTIAQLADVPFVDFARDLSGCRAHLERVLHDGEQVEEGAPCLKCETVNLRRKWGALEAQDGWYCPRCRQESTEDQYLFAVRAHFVANSDRLNADDMAVRLGIASSSIRRWANVLRVQASGEEAINLPPLIRPVERINGRKVYLVDEAVAIVSAGGDKRRTDWLARRAAAVLASEPTG
jgi:hypothetical protein